jgi:hypothetical protein
MNFREISKVLIYETLQSLLFLWFGKPQMLNRKCNLEATCLRTIEILLLHLCRNV